MFRIVIFLILLVNIKTVYPWSHKLLALKQANFAIMLIDKKPLRYCSFIFDENLISKESAKMQINQAIFNWLKAINFYDKTINIYDKNLSIINISEIEIKEISCSLKEGKDSFFRIEGRDKDNNTIIKSSDYISFFFSSRFNYSFYRQGAISGIEGKYIVLEEDQGIIGIQINDSYDDTIKKIPDKDKINYYLGDFVYQKINELYGNSDSPLYYYGHFIDDINYKGKLTWNDTYSTILHEIGHAFGLGDEYGDGFVKNNEKHMSALRFKDSVMRSGLILFPSIDDVIGLVYLFDRLVNIDYSKRSFNFKNYSTNLYNNEINFVKRGIKIEYDTRSSLANRKHRISLNYDKVDYNHFTLNIFPLLKENFEYRYYSDSSRIYLGSLSITNSNLFYLPKGFYFETLDFLDLSNNNLINIPSDIFRLINLEVLNLNNNSIKEIPAEISKLINLEVLLLENNKITELPKELLSLEKLKYIRLRNNNLKEIKSLKAIKEKSILLE